MADIKFDLGIQEYDINGRVKASFNPTDVLFIEAIFNCLEKIGDMQEEYQTAAAEAESREVFDLARKFDTEVRALINEAFGFDVCQPLFGRMPVNTLADGLPVWANFIFAIVDLFDASMTEEKSKTNPRIKKYTEKYKRKTK